MLLAPGAAVAELVGHVRQVDGEVAAVAVEYLPAAHVEHGELPAAALYLPPPHTRQTSFAGAAVGSSVSCPAAQAQAVLPGSDTEFSGQSSQ